MSKALTLIRLVYILRALVRYKVDILIVQNDRSNYRQ